MIDVFFVARFGKKLPGIVRVGSFFAGLFPPFTGHGMTRGSDQGFLKLSRVEDACFDRGTHFFFCGGSLT